MGNKEAKQQSQKLDFDLSKQQDSNRHGSHLSDFQNLDDLDFKSDSVESEENSYFGDGNKDNFEEQKVNVGMIRVNKKVKKVHDPETIKKLDE